MNVYRVLFWERWIAQGGKRPGMPIDGTLNVLAVDVESAVKKVRKERVGVRDEEDDSKVVSVQIREVTIVATVDVV